PSRAPAGPARPTGRTCRTSPSPPPTGRPPRRSMPRLREVPRAEVTDELILFFYDRLFGPDRDPAVDHGTATGSPGDWWTVFAQSQDVFRHAVKGFQLYRSEERRVGKECRFGVAPVRVVREWVMSN